MHELVGNALREHDAAARVAVVQVQGVDTLIIQPPTSSACRLAVWVDIGNATVHLLLGDDELPYDFVMAGSFEEPAVLEAALAKLRAIVEAVIEGRYGQERFVLRDGGLARVRGTFELAAGPLEHRVWRRRSLWRRYRRESVTFSPY